VELPTVDTISAQQLLHQLSDPAVAVIDLGSSVKYRDAHIPGAWWAVRSRLKQALARIGHAKQIVLVSPDGVLARLAAGDVRKLRPELGVRVLEGGSRAWLAAGLATENGMARATTEPTDVWYKPYENRDAMEQSMRDYITWEIALVPQIARDGDAKFRKF
jgi:3-mercaptopyruvate sulfurtransferase SseA